MPTYIWLFLLLPNILFLFALGLLYSLIGKIAQIESRLKELEEKEEKSLS